MTGHNELARFVNSLVDLGVADILLPFLLVFTISFSVLQSSNIFARGTGGHGTAQ